MEGVILFARNFGLETQADYPYAGVEQSCMQYRSFFTNAKPTGNTNVIQNSALELKTAITTGPV